MTTPTLYLIDQEGELSILPDVSSIYEEDGPDADGTISIAIETGERAICEVFQSREEALAMRDALIAALTRAALQLRPCVVFDVRDPSGTKASEAVEAAKRARLERDRAAARGGR